MRLSNSFLSRVVPAALFAGALFWSGSAKAVTCTNDIDCPDNSCGGQVCSWASTTHTCVAAGSAPQGQDGWCGADSDCKCMGQGAHCAAPHCTFTVPDGGGGGTDSGSSGGDSGASGSDGGLSGDSGAVTVRKDAGDQDGGGGGGGGSSGCAIGGDEVSGAAAGFGLVMVGLAGLFGRRRKR